MYQWRKDEEDEQFVRGILGKMLFSKDDIKKPVKVLSGGEKGRMLFGKIMMQRPNVIVMDEPTNHLDMESIESLNLALANYDRLDSIRLRGVSRCEIRIFAFRYHL